MPTYRLRTQLSASATAILSADTVDLGDGSTITIPETAREILSEGPNFASVVWDGSTPSEVAIATGPTSLTQSPAYRNGVASNPNLKSLRALAVVVEPVPRAIPAWTAGATTTAALSFFSDVGSAGTAQTAVVAATRAAGTSTVVAAGNWSDNIHPSGSTGLNNDTAAWATEIAASRFLPAIGAAELESSNVLQLCSVKFPYITEFGAGAPTHYYDKTFAVGANGTAAVHLLVLSAGLGTGQTAPNVSAAALAPQNAQWIWMEGRLAAVHSRFRIAVIHNPPVTSSPGAVILDDATELARSGHFDLIICGGADATEEIWLHGTPIINVSNIESGELPGTTLRGSTANVEQWWSAPAGIAAFLRVDATADSLTWQFRNVSGGAIIRQQTICPQPPAPLGCALLSVADYHDGDEPVYLVRAPLTPGATYLMRWPASLPITGDNAAISLGAYSGRTALRGCTVRLLASGF